MVVFLQGATPLLPQSGSQPEIQKPVDLPASLTFTVESMLSGQPPLNGT